MEQSWCFRGERFPFRGPRESHLIRTSSDCAAKLLLLFDMTMGWSGLRACAPMIGQNARQDSKKKTQGVTEATLVTIAEYDIFL